jgi:hypothetical protein
MTQKTKRRTKLQAHSISDSTNSMFKQRGFCKKLSPRKGIQEAFKFLVHNIGQIYYSMYLNPKLLRMESRKIILFAKSNYRFCLSGV